MSVVPSNAATPPAPPDKAAFEFLRGKFNALEKEHAETHDLAVAYVRNAVTEVLNATNIAFLLGAGCSSHVTDTHPPVELGIPPMNLLASEFFARISPAANALTTEEVTYLRSVGVDVNDARYKANIESFIEVLHAQRFVLFSTADPDIAALDAIIGKIEAFISAKCLEGAFSRDDFTVLDHYRRFYRKLVYRDRSLPRPWIFTSNYDLFSERALDNLSISFCNGFSGVIDRTFSPVTFKYALAEQLDVTSRKWAVVDNHLYLCKLHGSINWVEDAGAGMYGIREVQIPRTAGDTRSTMIFPTPQKHHATLASPYSDLFREFQSRIVREQTVLVTLGYSFSDSHIDNIIHQALTVPTFRLVIFGSPSHPGIKKLVGLDDPRIWVVHGKTPGGKPVHYFRYAADHFLPELPSDRIDTSVSRVIDLIREGALGLVNSTKP